MATHFKKEFQVRFREADPAGILYFANVFSLAHDCFEDFIESSGWGWKRWFTPTDFIVPIRHTESDYYRPFKPGEKYTITASVARIGESSFQMKYVFSQGEAKHAEVRMTHAFMSLATKQKTNIPKEIADHLKVYLDVESAQ